VILAGHSYGGMVITGVADRASDRIGRLVYLDAATPLDGQSLLDVAGPIIEATRLLGKVVDGVELVLLLGEGAGRFYGVNDPADLAWMDDRLAPHPWRCFELRLELTHEDALWADASIETPTWQVTVVRFEARQCPYGSSSSDARKARSAMANPAVRR